MGIALAIETLLLVAATLLAALTTVRPGAFSGDLVIAVLAVGMGVRNATVRRLGIPDLTTTVLTLTLTGFAAESRLVGGEGRGGVRRASAVVAMLVGALVGALALKSSLTLPLALAAGLAALTWGLYLPAVKRLRA